MSELTYILKLLTQHNDAIFKNFFLQELGDGDIVRYTNCPTDARKFSNYALATGEALNIYNRTGDKFVVERRSL